MFTKKMNKILVRNDPANWRGTVRTEWVPDFKLVSTDVQPLSGVSLPRAFQ